MEKLANEHMQHNLEAYVRGDINASKQRILFTKWVGEAWERQSAKKEMVARSFRKCGIAVAIDGSEDSEIHIEGIDDYAIEDEEDEEFTDEDPFDDIENADPLSDTDA